MTEKKSDPSVEELAAGVPLPHVAVTPLTVPCTLIQLQQWMQGVAPLCVPAGAAVSATATAISIA